MSPLEDGDNGNLETVRSTAVIRFVEGGGSKQWEAIIKTFERHEQQGVKTFLVDMDGVTYVNSTALALLVRLRKRSMDRGYTFQLINISPHIMDIFRTTRLKSFFFDLEEAEE